MLEQQPFGNGSGGRHALGRGAGKAMAGKATLGGAQYQLTPQITRHAEGAHLVSKHSPLWRSQGICCGARFPLRLLWLSGALGELDRIETERAANPVHDESSIPAGEHALQVRGVDLDAGKAR